jgi:tRNA pseudouridine55 synthase
MMDHQKPSNVLDLLLTHQTPITNHHHSFRSVITTSHFTIKLLLMGISIANNSAVRIVMLSLSVLLSRSVSSARSMQQVAFIASRSPSVRGRHFAFPSKLFSTSEETPVEEPVEPLPELSDDVPLLLSEGLMTVNKPLNWTSQDCVSYIRRMLERDTRERGGTVTKVTARRGNKSRKIRVGHGGTLDPLASGVLVIGIGKGTKELQQYLTGTKRYTARGECGFETTTLDMEGNVTKTAPFDHITIAAIEEALPSFTGRIQQIPPVFSAIKKGGKKMYQEARKGKTAEDMQIEPREVMIHSLSLVDPDESELPAFGISMECGGGTYVRSLIRDIGYAVGSVATTTVLTRTKQGRFVLDDVLEKDEWTPENICAEIEKFNAMRGDGLDIVEQ